MRYIQYRFTDPKDGAEYGGITRRMDQAQKNAKRITGITHSCWIRKVQFRAITIQFDHKVDAIMEALLDAMHFAHDVHEIVPMVDLKNEQDNENGSERCGVILAGPGKRSP